MRPILVVVTDILRDQPFQMPLVQDDDMIQQVSATASHPALGNALPRTAKGSAHRLATHAFRKGHYFLAESCIAVEDQETVRWRVRPRFAHLTLRIMAGGVAVAIWPSYKDRRGR